MSFLRRLISPRLSIILATAVLFLLPTAVFAQEEDGSGAAITLSLIGLILAIIMVVAVVGAVGLGIIGIGYNSTKGDDD
ncbi:MAG: hypothetical protein H6654_13495 [Ardenticatenaceae bacterium]|nr:hypothetical protein [Anaerolineales bacterium]MCB8941538.1 hypothetical protein [Ardenticatenaceae bacterium]MCB8974568.1 hypothetical protein [Ardenticatenaceae bacterium]